MEIPNLFANGSSYCFGRDGSFSYDCPKLHYDMIRDRSFLICRNAILQNPHIFRDKIVLEVNCGTAILSKFIASVGAKIVIGIEPSSMADEICENIEKENIKNIHIIKRNVHEIDELPFDIDKVDVIVSQWQAYLMFDKGLLEALLHARNKWLKTNGFIFPDTISLHIAGAECGSSQQEQASKYQFKCFSFNSLSEVFHEYAKIDYISWQQIVTNSATVRKMNLKKISIEDFSFSQNFTLTSLQSSPVHAFVLYFEVIFGRGHKTFVISSSPFEPRIRWKQIIFHFPNQLFLYPNDQLEGTFQMRSDDEKKTLNFGVTVNFLGTVSRTQFSKEYVLQ